MLRLIATAGLVALGTIGFASCGGGGGEEPPPNRGSLTITIPSTDPFATSSATVDVAGIAFNTNFFTSCSFVGVESGGGGTGVTVTWTNSAGGSGTASQEKHCCGFSFPGVLCNSFNTVGFHDWSATIPLVAGTNVVTVTARDASGNTGVDTITITH